jgi:hypothetical protein
VKHGARDDIPARIVSIKCGGVMCQVDVQLEGTDYRMSSLMINDLLDAMNAREGDRVHVLPRTVNVLLAKE